MKILVNFSYTEETFIVSLKTQKVDHIFDHDATVFK